MRAIVYHQAGPIDRADALIDTDLPDPVASGRDLLVDIRAISVNPVDVQSRQNESPEDPAGRVLGWDAAGVVRSVGPDVSLFRPGDEVFYAGDFTRPGTNAQFQLVDERIVGRKPTTLDWAKAAALPLTAITAWEALFDRLNIRRPIAGASNVILVIGGAGGVGSIAVQLLRQLTDLTIITTASRDETRAWATDMGAHHVIDHSKPLASQVEALGIGAPDFVFSTTHTARHFNDIVELIAPQGRFALIDDHMTFDIVPFMLKSVSIHWELMFTRSSYGTADLGEQGALLNEVADLIDAGRLRTTMTERLSPIDAATLRIAHRKVETAAMRGKLVVEGWA